MTSSFTEEMSLTIIAVLTAQFTLYCATCYLLCREGVSRSFRKNGNVAREPRASGTELAPIGRTLSLPETDSLEISQTALGLVQCPELDPITGVALTVAQSPLFLVKRV